MCTGQWVNDALWQGGIGGQSGCVFLGLEFVYVHVTVCVR